MQGLDQVILGLAMVAETGQGQPDLVVAERRPEGPRQPLAHREDLPVFLERLLVAADLEVDQTEIVDDLDRPLAVGAVGLDHRLEGSLEMIRGFREPAEGEIGPAEGAIRATHQGMGLAERAAPDLFRCQQLLEGLLVAPLDQQGATEGVPAGGDVGVIVSVESAADLHRPGGVIFRQGELASLAIDRRGGLVPAASQVRRSQGTDRAVGDLGILGRRDHRPQPFGVGTGLERAQAGGDLDGSPNHRGVGLLEESDRRFHLLPAVAEARSS